MDPCFRFPVDDLQWLFDQASVVEGMLIALEHMQVNFVTVSSTGLRKFRRNTLSFPQDIGSFARRQQLMKSYKVGDRVNSSRGPAVIVIVPTERRGARRRRQRKSVRSMLWTQEGRWFSLRAWWKSGPMVC